MTENEISNLLKLTPAELTDMGICPTCFDRMTGGRLYGDNSQILFFEDSDIECFLVKNPRAQGHACISSVTHYHDMSEAPDELNEKIVRFAKQLMIIIREVYGCERVYLCTMCDGPANHYHVQLIPRYKNEKRGSENFTKKRLDYVFDKKKLDSLKSKINAFANNESK